MMYVIEKGGVPTYSGGCDELVYLVTTVERLMELERPTLFTDRNAMLAIARFTDQVGTLDELVDWTLMKGRMWNDTEDEPDRMERRMAECLVHRRVPWEAFQQVVTRNLACAQRVRSSLAMDASISVVVRPGWYF